MIPLSIPTPARVVDTGAPPFSDLPAVLRVPVGWDPDDWIRTKWPFMQGSTRGWAPAKWARIRTRTADRLRAGL